MLADNPGREGHVYILVSPNCSQIKIGGTDHAPLKRIKEINACEPYKSLGPWSLHDFRQVSDWKKVEYSLHYALRSRFASSVPGQRELFDLPPTDAARLLQDIEPSLLLRKPKADRLFQDEELSHYLGELFQFTGLFNWLDLQGAWTLNLFPSTSGGRYYTINIGRHEVAFATLPRPQRPRLHMLHLDSLIHGLPEARAWLAGKEGELLDDVYASGLPRSTAIWFEASFQEALEFLQLPGVRRALLAYWTDALMQLQEKTSLSPFARHHHWNAVAELRQRASKLVHSTIKTCNLPP